MLIKVTDGMFIPISLLTQLGLLSSSTSFQLFLKKKCKKMSHNYLDKNNTVSSPANIYSNN